MQHLLFRADDGGPQGDRAGGGYLAKQFGATVEVGCVRGGFLGVHACLAGKDTVSTDVDQAAASDVAELCQPMGQHGVERNGLERVVGIGYLLDQPDAVDNDVGLDTGKDPHNRVGVLDIDSGEEVWLEPVGKVSPSRLAAGRTNHRVGTAVTEHAEHGVAEHAGGTENKNLHAKTLARGGNPEV